MQKAFLLRRAGKKLSKSLVEKLNLQNLELCSLNTPHQKRGKVKVKISSKLTRMHCSLRQDKDPKVIHLGAGAWGSPGSALSDGTRGRTRPHRHHEPRERQPEGSAEEKAVGNARPSSLTWAPELRFPDPQLLKVYTPGFKFNSDGCAQS